MRYLAAICARRSQNTIRRRDFSLPCSPRQQRFIRSFFPFFLSFPFHEISPSSKLTSNVSRSSTIDISYRLLIFYRLKRYDEFFITLPSSFRSPFIPYYPFLDRRRFVSSFRLERSRIIIVGSYRFNRYYSSV